MVLFLLCFGNTIADNKSHGLELIVLLFARFGREVEHQMLQVQVLEKREEHRRYGIRVLVDSGRECDEKE